MIGFQYSYHLSKTMAHSTIKIRFTIHVYMYFDVETVSFVLNATERSYNVHTGILKYSEHMESIKKQLQSLQTGHTHTQIQMKSPQIFCIQNCNHYKCNILQQHY